MLENELAKQKAHLEHLKSILDTSLNFKDRCENDRQDMGRLLASLRENIRFIRRKAIVVSIEEFAKTKGSFKELVKRVSDADIAIRNLEGSIKKQKQLILQQEFAVKELEYAMNKDNVLEFKRRANG